MARKHPFGPAAAKIEKQAFTAEKVKTRLQVALQRFHKSLAKLPETTSDSNPEAEGGRSK